MSTVRPNWRRSPDLRPERSPPSRQRPRVRARAATGTRPPGRRGHSPGRRRRPVRRAGGCEPAGRDPLRDNRGAPHARWSTPPVPLRQPDQLLPPPARTLPLPAVTPTSITSAPLHATTAPLRHAATPARTWANVARAAGRRTPYRGRDDIDELAARIAAVRG